MAVVYSGRQGCVEDRRTQRFRSSQVHRNLVSTVKTVTVEPTVLTFRTAEISTERDVEVLTCPGKSCEFARSISYCRTRGVRHSSAASFRKCHPSIQTPYDKHAGGGPLTISGQLMIGRSYATCDKATEMLRRRCRQRGIFWQSLLESS